jgi:alanine-glyoxylate transaminase/serine-glyoxylate transaminase/serine-pyruvate transaminase
MSIPGQLTPSPRLLLGPGPSDAHPRVLAAMTTPLLGHLDPQFLELMTETQAMLRTVYGTKNPLTFPVSATGMAGMETCVVNLIEPGDRMIVCNNGFFGNRMVDVAGRAGATVIELKKPWGHVFTAAEVRAAVLEHKPKALGIVHAETSTGAWQPLAEIGAIGRETGTLIVADCVTSLGCVPVELDAWGIDAAYSCSQKGLGCPPGLSPISFGDRAVSAMLGRKTKVQSWYLDLSIINSYWGSDRAYHHTAPISMIYALREGLRIVLEEGLESRYARHRRNHVALKAGLEAIGLSYIADPAHQLPQLNAVRIPAGIDDLASRKRLLADFGIEIGGGLGEFKGKAWRIGLMGYNAKPAAVLLVLAALEQVLGATPGSGVAAAERAYANA